MPRLYSLAAARDFVPLLREHVAGLIAVRADLAEARLAVQRGEEPVGGIPEMKALEARLQEAIDWFPAQGLQLKGIAPVIVDFPSTLHGEPALLCWLEGELDLAWYHRPEVGFLGRRPLPPDA
ncbi:MAG TPA: DUF2203 domain-containing protein [Egibacteraceae bacterium]